MKTQQIRQGDVFVSPTRSRPSAQAKLVLDSGRVILAYGEVTGHAHEVIAEVIGEDTIPASALFEEPDGTRFLIVDRPCSLRHEEHGPIPTLANGRFNRCPCQISQCRLGAESLHAHQAIRLG